MKATTKLASLNVEHLIERAKALNEPNATEKRLLDDYAKLNALMAKPTHSTADKTALSCHARDSCWHAICVPRFVLARGKTKCRHLAFMLWRVQTAARHLA